mgnify:CR=1 FL=1
MELNENTNLTDILDAYPDLEGRLMKDEKVAALASTPLAKMLLKKATLKDASRLSGMPLEELIDELRRMIS